ncbi:hypothetical protein [Desulfobacula sp.]|uniref:hypothetical protein n=1 Tax=Desulfobacula sp. TaxID=2593537 RepID=UPI00260317C9|nr:hypothetical protein [Desulfobacula sp.]
MGNNICKFQENRLADLLCSLKIKGEVIEKKMTEPLGGQPEKKIVIVKFKDRIIEAGLNNSQFERAEIGKQIWFSPPVPERDSCNCHLFAWLIAGVLAGLLAVWAITSHFQERTAVFLSFAAVGWISVIAWARICSHEQSKCLRDLEMEIDFFEGANTSCREDLQ